VEASGETDESSISAIWENVAFLCPMCSREILKESSKCLFLLDLVLLRMIVPLMRTPHSHSLLLLEGTELSRSRAIGLPGEESRIVLFVTENCIASSFQRSWQQVAVPVLAIHPA
jgi:hypothetical protein